VGKEVSDPHLLLDWQLAAHNPVSAELDALRAERGRLREALQWYADNLGESRSRDVRILVQDGGQRARNALVQKEPPA
jgi:hypothetical protein